MKFCPHCKINIGGNLEKCPLCQNLLTGTGEEDYCPKIEIKTRKRHKAFKIVTFCVRPSWSPLVLGWLLVSGWLLEFILRKHYNLLKTLFLSMIAVSILCQFTESYMYLAWSAWNIPYLGITSGYIIPILCSANMVANFVLSMILLQRQTAPYMVHLSGNQHPCFRRTCNLSRANRFIGIQKKISYVI